MRKTTFGYIKSSTLLGMLLLLSIMAGSKELRAQAPNEAANSGGRLAHVANGGTDDATTGRLLILEGQRVHNSISSKAAISPVVQLLGSDGRAIADAEVVFQAPAKGAGGQFGVAPIATVKTDRVGQATARFTPNNQPGRFTIQVQAKWPKGTAEVTIVQYNDVDLSSPVARITKRPWYRDWRVWAAVGGGAAVGTWLSRRNTTSGPTTITIIPSPVGIGGAR